MAAAAGAGVDESVRPSIEKGRIALPPNSQYEYQAQDINTLLALRVHKTPGLKDILVRKSVDLLAHRKKNGKNIPELASKLLVKTSRTLLIPCNIGNNHWVGLLLKFSKECSLERSEVIDSLSESTIPEELNRQLQLVFPGHSFKLVKGAFIQEDLTSSGAYVIENLLSRVKEAPTLTITKSATHEIRLLHLDQLKEKFSEIGISAKERQNCEDFFKNFSTRQFYNIPNFRTDQHLKDSDDDSSDDEPLYSSFESMGWKFNKYIFSFTDQALITSILAIMSENPELSPEAWYDRVLRKLWTSLDNAEVKAALIAILGKDFGGISCDEYLVLNKHCIGHKGIQSIHNFFKFYHRVHSTAQDAFKFAPAFLMELIQLPNVSASLLAMFAKFSYICNGIFISPLHASIILLKDNEYIHPYAEFLLAKAPILNKDFLAEQIHLAMSNYNRDLSASDRFNVAAHFASRMMSNDLLSILNKAKVNGKPFNLLKAYDKNLSWLCGEPFLAEDTDFEGFDLKQYFSIRVTLILQLILEIEHDLIDTNKINAAFSALSVDAAESREVPRDKNKKLLINRLIAELARDLVSCQIMIIINYINDEELKRSKPELVEKLFNCFAAGVIQSFSDLPIGVSQIIPLTWDSNLKLISGSEVSSGHVLYLQVTATEKNYIFNLHNYGANAQLNNAENVNHVVYNPDDRSKFYEPHRLGVIAKKMLALTSSTDSNESYSRVQRLLSFAFTKPKKEKAASIYYHSLSGALPKLLPGTLPQLGDNCVFYGFNWAQYCATLSYGESWHEWLREQEIILISRVKIYIPEFKLNTALWLAERGDGTSSRSYNLDIFWNDLCPLKTELLEPLTASMAISATSVTSFYSMATYASTAIGRIFRAPAGAK